MRDPAKAPFCQYFGDKFRKISDFESFIFAKRLQCYRIGGKKFNAEVLIAFARVKFYGFFDNLRCHVCLFQPLSDVGECLFMECVHKRLIIGHKVAQASIDLAECGCERF